MNRVYTHKNNNYNALTNFIIILLIPFFIFSFYKNGYILYKSNLVSLTMMFKPLYFLGASIIINLFYRLVVKDKVNRTYNLLGNLLISIIAMPQTNIYVYLIILLFFNIVHIFLKINIATFFVLALALYMHYTKNYTFNNLIENMDIYKYTFIDYLIGKSAGGIGSAFILWSVLSYAILSIYREYKRQIPLLGFTLYYILITAMAFIKSNADITFFVNANIIFSFIFIAPLSLYSPYTKGGCYIYGFFLGLFTFLFSLVDVNLAPFISIGILSLIHPLIDKIITK